MMIPTYTYEQDTNNTHTDKQTPMTQTTPMSFSKLVPRKQGNPSESTLNPKP